MPAIVRITVHCARNLPVMDALSKLADAYVELTFGKQPSRKSDFVRKSLCPSWEWSQRYELPDDAEACKEPLVFTVLDKDFIQDDVIGQVIISIEPLMAAVAGPSSTRALHGWLPIYDTLEGLRGELFVTVRVSHFGDRQQAASTMTRELTQQVASTTPVSFFSLCALDTALFPQQVLLGFVEELIVDSDPDYEFTVADTFRTSRLSNQQRQLLLHRLAYQLRDLISKKVHRMGGNAVLGFQLHYDMEGDSGIVARAYGTCVRLLGPPDVSSSADATAAGRNLFGTGTPRISQPRRRRDDSVPSHHDGDAEDSADADEGLRSAQSSRGGKLTPTPLGAATGRSHASGGADGPASGAPVSSAGLDVAATPDHDAHAAAVSSRRRSRSLQTRRVPRLTLADVIPFTSNMLRTAAVFEKHNLV
jgi:hypothetical protein